MAMRSASGPVREEKSRFTMTSMCNMRLTHNAERPPASIESGVASSDGCHNKRTRDLARGSLQAALLSIGRLRRSFTVKETWLVRRERSFQLRTATYLCTFPRGTRHIGSIDFSLRWILAQTLRTQTNLARSR
jgi:hypothetical protein